MAKRSVTVKDVVNDTLEVDFRDGIVYMDIPRKVWLQVRRPAARKFFTRCLELLDATDPKNAGGTRRKG